MASVSVEQVTISDLHDLWDKWMQVLDDAEPYSEMFLTYAEHEPALADLVKDFSALTRVWFKMAEEMHERIRDEQSKETAAMPVKCSAEGCQAHSWEMSKYALQHVGWYLPYPGDADQAIYCPTHNKARADGAHWR